MYFKFSIRKNPKTQTMCSYFRLVESYRDINNRICHRTVLNVGFLDEVNPEQLRIVQQTLTELSAGKTNSTAQTDEVVTSLTEILWTKIVSERRIDRRGPKALPKKVKPLKLEVIHNKQVRELGKEWLCYQCLKQLDLTSCLKSFGWDEEQIQLTFTQVICRASYPASELKRSKIIQQLSAVCEITGYPIAKISKDKLYKNAQALHKQKDALEAYLSKKTNGLFDIKSEVILYNLTNIYFESGLDKQNKGSNEKPNNQKQIILAMSINQEGFLKYSHIFNDNANEVGTITAIANHLSLLNGLQKERVLLVIDAAIATEDTLRSLEDKAYNYICVSRSKLKDYQPVENTQPVEVLNKNQEQLTLQQVIGEKSRDYYLKGKSLNEETKQIGIRNRFEIRVVEELQKINLSVLKKHGIKDKTKIQQRVNKILEKYPTASRCFTITVTNNEKTDAVEIKWDKKEKFRLNKKDLGVYFIRTNLSLTNERLLWQSYNTIKEIQTSFRTIKSNLDLYPFHHENDEFTLAHLHVDLLAYWVANTVRHQLKQKNIYHSWQDILTIASSQKLVITNAQNQFDETVVTKRSSEPTKDLSKIIDALQYKHFPFTSRRFIVKNALIQKN